MLTCVGKQKCNIYLDDLFMAKLVIVTLIDDLSKDMVSRNITNPIRYHLNLPQRHTG